MYHSLPSILDVYNRFGEEVKLHIIHEPDDFIIGGDTEELVEYYFSTKHFKPIEIDKERTELAEIRKELRVVPARQRDTIYQREGDTVFEYESIHISIPVIDNSQLSELLKMRTSSFSISWSPDEVKWNRFSIDFIIDLKGYGFERDHKAVAQEIQQQKNHIFSHIHLIASDIEKGNNELKQKIRKAIEDRKQKILNDKDKYSSLLKEINIPLKKKDDAMITRIKLDTKPLVHRVRPNPKQPENYFIDRDKVLDIITILDNQGRQFEKTPNSFLGSGEEDLRNILLVTLNGIFEGKATGETFNAKGKTDIYLNIARGNILVCECKIWGGQNLYKETIDQLLGYLTWRENYGIVITFVRNKGFTKVLTDAKNPIQKHITYRQGFHQVSDSHFMSHHVLPTDNLKTVEIHHLFYNI